MRSRKREAIFMGIGILAGLALSGPATQAATTAFTANPTSQTFYVNGQEMKFEAYEIHGNNFVKLRDIGKAVNFSVAYDAATNSVRIDSTRPYQEKTAQPTAPALGITEESVQASLARLKAIYPDGTVYPTPCRSASNGPYTKGIHCAGWAMMCSDAAFGDLPWRRIDRPNWEQLRPGDLVEYKNSESYHVVVVVSKTDSYIRVTESGKNNKALWGGQYFQWWLEEQPHYISYTRYPQ